MSGRPNLVGLGSEEIGDLVEPHVERRFRGRQVARWIIHRDATSFAEMTDLSKDLRQELNRVFEIREPEITDTVESEDGARKYLFRLDDGATVEGVLMPAERKTTLCLSSQAGCAVGCTFCVTGKLGAGRNLGADEIVGHLRRMLRDGGCATDRVNVVFMGMGEPLLNTTHLGQALRVMFETISPKRITVSTSGILPGIAWLAGLEKRPKLAVSLNAPDQEVREGIMPITRRHPLDALMAELRRFPLEKGRRITFEYVLIRGVNDSPDQARATAALIRGIPAKVNLIPLNEDPTHLPQLQRPDEAVIEAFAVVLRDAGLVVTVRRSRGGEVAAACGQLRGSSEQVSRT